MVLTNSPVTRAFIYYVSLFYLYINNYLLLLINLLLKESTLHFPNSNYYLIYYINYLEIQARGLTVDLTPYDENKMPLFPDLSIRASYPLFVPNSLTMDSVWAT